MFKRKCLSNAVAAAFLAASAQLACAVNEGEPAGTMGVNDSFDSAQQLAFDTDGKITVDGTIGVTDWGQQTPKPDVDFYFFEAKGGEVITVDIDGGIKPDVTSTQHVDTIITLFRIGAAGTWESLIPNDNTQVIDEGSEPIGGERDARIDEFKLPDVPGKYIVGVSSAPRAFKFDGSMSSTVVDSTVDPRAMFPNGTYTLIISRKQVQEEQPQVQYVSIDIKPGDPDEVTRLNPKFKRLVPIALLSNAATASSPAFNALDVKVDSITFGRGGEEKSLVHCHNHNYNHKHNHKHGKDANGDGIPDKLVRDVNRDGLPDLVCLFDISAGAFTEDDLVGKMKGESANGTRFEAAARLKVKLPRKYRRHYHRDDD